MTQINQWQLEQLECQCSENNTPHDCPYYHSFESSGIKNGPNHYWSTVTNVICNTPFPKGYFHTENEMIEVNIVEVIESLKQIIYL